MNGTRQPEGEGGGFTVTLDKLPEKEYAETTTTSGGGGCNPLKWLLFISSSNSLVKHFEAFFKWEGEQVSLHSVKVLIGCLIFVSIGCAGLPYLHTENNAIRLWLPQESDFAVNYGWLWSTYPPEFREHSVIIHGEDVLTPPAIQKMYEIYKRVYTIRTEVYNRTWEQSCFRRPVLKLSSDMFDSRRKRRAQDLDAEFEKFDEEFSGQADFSIDNYPEPYCGMVQTLPTACFHETILELWAHEGEFNERADEKIQGLTREEILYKINNWGHSELYLTERDYRPMLGGVKYDSEGKIVGASAVIMKWMGRMNATRALLEGGSDSAGTGELVDSETEEFESALSRVLLEAGTIEPKDILVEVNVASSFGQIASSTILTDVNYLIISFCIVFVYVNLMLGRFNLVEQRAFVSLMGLLSVGMSIFFSYGLCSVLGMPFGPLHNLIPFLLMGIGIDDMFVTAQCFNNLPSNIQKKSLETRMGETMLRAGSAITITSLTDFIAFIIGGTTALPALRSFCVFCAVGILVVYILQATWFIAWFSLDQKRIEQKRNGTIPCYIHSDYTPNSLSQKNLLQDVFKRLGDILITAPVKIVVLLVTAAIFGMSVWGNMLLRQEFNPIWFLPPDSYLAQWHQSSAKYFPSGGEQVTVFMADLDLPGDLYKLEHMHSALGNESWSVVSVDSWFTGFKTYMGKNYAEDGSIYELTPDQFGERLTQYLFSPLGSKYRFLFTFEEDLTCGKKSPMAQLSMMNFRHRLMKGPEEQIPAMNRVKNIFKEANFTGRVFPMAQGYASWETDEVIGVELYRNMFLAVLCIFITTWILLFNLLASIQVLFSVILTLVNVAGFMHFWGLTVDTVSCTNLIIAIGLCVDYSAHIAHTFMTSVGPRDTRVRDTLQKIGPAVLNGGFSTFLAFLLLAGSRSHVFQSFFKIFFLVVVFGLYNGLIFLPVLLSYLGPRSYNEEVRVKSTAEEAEPLKPILKENKNTSHPKSGNTDTLLSNTVQDSSSSDPVHSNGGGDLGPSNGTAKL